MAGVTIIDQATRQISLGLAYSEAVRAAFWEKFGFRLEVDPGFVDDYNYNIRDGLGNVADLALPHVKWVEGFREGWLRYQAANARFGESRRATLADEPSLIKHADGSLSYPE